MAVQTRKFEFQKDVPVEEINRFYRENNIDRTQILSVVLIQKTPNAGVYMVTYEDTVLPEVVGTSPADGASGVPTGIDVIVQFSEAVQTVGSGDISVTEDGSPVAVPPGDIITAGSKLTIQNVVDEFDAAYVFTLLTSIQDTNNNPLARPYVFSFITTPESAGVVIKTGRVTPDGADISQGYHDVTFNESFLSDAYKVWDPSFHHTSALPTGVADVGTPWRVSNKMAAGFRINFDTPFPSGASLEWGAIFGAPS